MMNAARLFGKGISFPPRVGADGRIAWSLGEDNIREAIYVILMTQLRERVRLPEFGGNLVLYLFEPNTVTTRHMLQDRIVKALTQWEPRINLDSVTVEPDPADAQAAIATITYKLVATQAQTRLSMNVRLAS
jgi:uncharacterized protein